MTAPSVSPDTLDRAVGAIVGSACGDALGAPYEFHPSLPDGVPVLWKAGGPWELGEWTDDTSMAVPILRAAAAGRSLIEDGVQGAIARAWIHWSRDAKDVGIQTREVFGRITAAELDAATDERLAELSRTAARAVHTARGRSAGNGSLMRTGPVALASLDDPDGLASRARSLSELTHIENDAGDACVIWSLAIRHAILTGEFDLRGQLAALPEDRRQLWNERIDVAEAVAAPRDVPGSNGWVVAALQAAWSAIVRGDGLIDTLERAVRCGNDTDTVAAIAGSLAGAKYGTADVPSSWRQQLHGWPGLDYDDLVALAAAAIRADDGE